MQWMTLELQDPVKRLLSWGAAKGVSPGLRAVRGRYPSCFGTSLTEKAPEALLGALKGRKGCATDWLGSGLIHQRRLALGMGRCVYETC